MVTTNLCTSVGVSASTDVSSTTSTVCFTTLVASVDTSQSTDTIPARVTTPIVCTMGSSIASTNTTKLNTSTTTTPTAATKSRKSTNKFYKRYPTPTTLETFGENRQTCFENHEEMLHYSDIGQTDFVELGQTKSKLGSTFLPFNLKLSK